MWFSFRRLFCTAYRELYCRRSSRDRCYQSNKGNRKSDCFADIDRVGARSNLWESAVAD
jgi:hypothetical protein